MIESDEDHCPENQMMDAYAILPSTEDLSFKEFNDLSFGKENIFPN